MNCSHLGTYRAGTQIRVSSQWVSLDSPIRPNDYLIVLSRVSQPAWQSLQSQGSAVGKKAAGGRAFERGRRQVCFNDPITSQDKAVGKRFFALLAG
jgi:hypothetical protein